MVSLPVRGDQAMLQQVFFLIIDKTWATWLMYWSAANFLVPLTTRRTNSGKVNWNESLSLLEELWNSFHTLVESLSAVANPSWWLKLTWQYTCLVHADTHPKEQLGETFLSLLRIQKDMKSSQDLLLYPPPHLTVNLICSFFTCQHSLLQRRAAHLMKKNIWIITTSQNRSKPTWSSWKDFPEQLDGQVFRMKLFGSHLLRKHWRLNFCRCIGSIDICIQYLPIESTHLQIIRRQCCLDLYGRWISF